MGENVPSGGRKQLFTVQYSRIVSIFQLQKNKRQKNLESKNGENDLQLTGNKHKNYSEIVRNCESKKRWSEIFKNFKEIKTNRIPT